MRLIDKVYSFVPPFLRRRIPSFRRQRRFNKIKKTKPVTKQDILNDLRKLGLKEGDIVLVHSSLSAIGYVEGSTDTVIDALLEAVGEDGTIMVPTFPFIDFMASYVKKNPVFDVRRTPSKMGVITEKFRQRTESLRSCHPTHSVAAIGKQALFMTAGHENSYYPFDKSSPFWKLIEIKGYVLLLGVDYESMTVFRTFECIVSNFTFEVYLEKPVELHVIDGEGREKTVVTKVQSPKVSKIRSNSIVGEYFDKHGFSRTGYVGMARSRLIFVGDLMDRMSELLNMGITTYKRNIK